MHICVWTYEYIYNLNWKWLLLWPECFCPIQIHMFKLSIPNMILLGGEALERQLGLDELSGWNPCEGMSVLTNLPLSQHPS